MARPYFVCTLIADGEGRRTIRKDNAPYESVSRMLNGSIPFDVKPEVVVLPSQDTDAEAGTAVRKVAFNYRIKLRTVGSSSVIGEEGYRGEKQAIEEDSRRDADFRASGLEIEQWAAHYSSGEDPLRHHEFEPAGRIIKMSNKT